MTNTLLLKIATLNFKPLDEEDQLIFQGAEEGTLIAYEEETVYLLLDNVLSVIEEFGLTQVDYTFTAKAEEIF
jgi:hypothetical protein